MWRRGIYVWLGEVERVKDILSSFVDTEKVREFKDKRQHQDNDSISLTLFVKAETFLVLSYIFGRGA